MGISEYGDRARADFYILGIILANHVLETVFTTIVIARYSSTVGTLLTVKQEA